MKKLLEKEDISYMLMQLLYKKFWDQKNIIKKYCYAIFPLVILVAFYWGLYAFGAFTMKGFSLSVDYANLLMIPYIFLFGYYCGGWLYKYSCNVVNGLLKEYNLKDKLKDKLATIEKIYKVFQLGMCFVPLLAGIFIYTATLDGDLNWYSCLSTWLFVCYVIVIALSWYLSACLIITVVFALIKIHIIISNIDSSDVNVYHHDGNCGFYICNKFIVICLGISLYDLFAGSVIFISDFNAINYNVKHAFYLYPWIGFIFLLLFFLYLILVLIVMFESISKINQSLKITKEKVTDPKSSEYMLLSNVKSFPITMQMLGVFLSVWVIPLLMFIITVWDLFNNIK